MGNPSDSLMAEIFEEKLKNCFLALYRADPKGDDSGSGAEVGADGYQRQSISLGAPYLEAGAMVAKNTNSITFPALSAEDGYGEITHVALRSEQYGGKQRFRERLPRPITVGKDGKIEIKTGELKITLW